MSLARGPVRRRPIVDRDSRTVTDDELRGLLDAAAAGLRRELARGVLRGPRARDMLIVQVGAGAGLRASELAALRCGDFSADGGSVRVRGGKARKEAHVDTVPLPPEVSAAAATWRRGRPADEPMFTRTRTGAQMTRRHIWEAIKRLARRAGLRSDISPHALRHWYTTALVKAGHAPAVVAKLTRHRSMDVVLDYYHDAEAARAAAQSLPMLDGRRLRPRRTMA